MRGRFSINSICLSLKQLPGNTVFLKYFPMRDPTRSTIRNFIIPFLLIKMLMSTRRDLKKKQIS
ncbi:MAG: hypothetical protein A2W09_01740 [Deltaproteobacteria bacterium RBG_16_50_11]|nr:MAG: hypothetical protein A2W09_01740 [Deltaproteobacteria bacterium RBG_16_50_11]